MKELLIRIRAIFEGRAADDAADALDNVKREAERASAAFGDQAEATSAKGSGLMRTIAGIGVALGGIAGAFRLASRAIQEFAAKQESIATLDQALRNAGQTSKGYREDLQKLAAEQQKLTAIADTSWTAVFEVLTKFGSTRETIREHTEAVKNLAGFTGLDLPQAATLFGRAMQGQTEMLTRYGITIDKTLDSTAQLDQIMQQVAARGGGILEERAKTINGQIQLLNNNFGDLLATIGGAGAKTGILGGIFDNLNMSMAFWQDLIGSTIPPVSALTERIKMQALSTEDLEAAHKASAESLEALGNANIAADKKIQTNIATLQKQKRAELEIAALRRDKAIEEIRASDSTEAEKISAIAAINTRFRQTELDAERNNAAEIARIRTAAAAEAAESIEALRAQHAEAAAAAEQAQTKAASDRSKVNELNAQKDRFAALESDAAERENRLTKLRSTRERQVQKFEGTSYIDEEIRKEEQVLNSINQTLEYRRELLENADVDLDSEVAAQQAQLQADALAEQLALLEERQAALQATAAAEADAQEENLSHLEEKKTIEQEIADIRTQQSLAAAEEAAAKKQEVADRQAARDAQKEQTASKKEELAAAKELASLGPGKIDARRRRSQADLDKGPAGQRSIEDSRLDNPANNFSNKFNNQTNPQNQSPLGAPPPAPGTSPSAPGTSPSAPSGADPGQAIAEAAAPAGEAAAKIAEAAQSLQAANQSIDTAAASAEAAAGEAKAAASTLQKTLGQLKADIAALRRAAT